MPDDIGSVMTAEPVCCDAQATLTEAAKLMDQRDIGDVLVMEGDRLCGIVTDRDITVRAVAQGMDPATTKLGAICSREIVTLSRDDSVDQAISMMREKAIRRLPVVDGSKPVGVVSLGDLAGERDRRSVLGEISAAASNN